MTLTRAAVLRPGDWVAFDGGEYQVLALAGTSVRLRSTDGRETVVLAAYLMAAPEFVVIDAAPASTLVLRAAVAVTRASHSYSAPLREKLRSNAGFETFKIGSRSLAPLIRNAIMVRRAILGRGLLPLLGRAILGRDSSVQPPRIPTLRHSRPP